MTTINKKAVARSCNSGDRDDHPTTQKEEGTINMSISDLSSEALSSAVDNYFNEKMAAGEVTYDPATGEYVADNDGIPSIDRPCPTWCQLEPGHGWESTWADHTRVSRFHVRYISRGIATGAMVSITSEETAAIKDCGHAKPTYERRADGHLDRIACDCPLEAAGPSELSAFVVSHDIPEDLASEEALQIGTWLRQAAHRLRQLEADRKADEFISALEYALKGAHVEAEQVQEILGLDEIEDAHRILHDLGAQTFDTLNDLTSAAGLRLSEIGASVEETRRG